MIKKTLVIFEMDFGLNNVIRKNEEEIDESAHMLIAGILLTKNY